MYTYVYMFRSYNKGVEDVFVRIAGILFCGSLVVTASKPFSDCWAESIISDCGVTVLTGCCEKRLQELSQLF